MRLRVFKCVLLAGLLAAWSSSALASGFAIIEQSVSGLGTAYAGGAASAEDATTIFYNPAGMTLLEGQQVVAGVHVIIPSAKFSNDGTTNALGQPISGGDGGDGGVVKPVPNLYYTANLGNGLVVGLGVHAPFGLATDYNKDWVGRYHAVKSSVETININPSVAYKVNEHLSLGAGVSAQYIDVNLTSMVDYGLSAYSTVGEALQAAIAGGAPVATITFLNNALTALQTAPSNPDADVYADMKADDWGYGYNLGVLYEFDQDSRIGMSYRSEIKHTLKGDVDFSAQNAAYLASVGLDASADFPDQDLSGKITLPAMASLSGYHRFNPQWAVMADISWTQWSSFKELVIKFDGDLPDSVTTENWKDTWRYSVGTTYTPNEQLVLRLGLAYDETPIPSSRHRTPRIPGNNRFWTAIGAGYQIIDGLNLDVAYAHLFVKDAKIDKTLADEENLGRGNLVGKYENSVDIVSLQLAYNF